MILAAAPPASSAAVHARLLADFTRYHLTFVVVGSLLGLAAGVLCGCTWRRYRSASSTGGPGARSVRWTHLGFAVLGLVVALGLAVLVAANLSTVLSPQPGLDGAIGPGAVPIPALAPELEDWVRSGQTELPTPIRQRVEERLAWQLPKAVVCTVLLVGLALLSLVLWRRLLRQSRSESPVTGPGRRRLAAAGCLTVLGCLVLVPMVLGTTQAAVAPLTLTVLLG